MSTLKSYDDLLIGDIFLTNYNNFPLEVTVAAKRNGRVIPSDKRDFSQIILLHYEVIRTIPYQAIKAARKRKLTRRYYCHQRIKSLVKYSSKNKTCFIPYDRQDLADNYWITELRNTFGYNLQLQIS